MRNMSQYLVGRRIHTMLSVSCVLGILSVVLCTLLGCGLPAQSVTSAPTPTIQQILAHARAVRIGDGIINLTLSSTKQGQPPEHGTGTIKFTSQPERLDLGITLSSGETVFSGEEIADAATNSVYAKVDVPSKFTSNTWTKTQNGFDFASFNNVLHYANLGNPVLLGGESLQHVRVWHLRGSAVNQGPNTSLDVYLRQDNFLPVEVVLTTRGNPSGTVTYFYTALNTGISIVLPVLPTPTVGASSQ